MVKGDYKQETKLDQGGKAMNIGTWIGVAIAIPLVVTLLELATDYGTTYYFLLFVPILVVVALHIIGVNVHKYYSDREKKE